MPGFGSHHLLDYISSARSEEHTSELQSRLHLVCRLLLEKKKTTTHRARLVSDDDLVEFLCPEAKQLMVHYYHPANRTTERSTVPTLTRLDVTTTEVCVSS